MKKVYVSDKTMMVLESMDNINKRHNLYNSFYEKEVEEYFHVNVSDNARVFGNASVSGNAEVYGKARIYGNASVFGNASVSGNAEVSDNASVFDNAEVSGEAFVFGNARVSGNAEVYGNAEVINLIGLPYNITITDKHIQIGCKQFTFEVAKKLAERNIDIDSDDYNEMIKYKDLLLELIKVRES